MVSQDRSLGAGRLYSIIEGPIRFALLKWALDQGIFDLCQTPKDAAFVAASNGYDPQQCRIVLRALVAAGFLEHADSADQTSYVVAADIGAFVCSDSPVSLVENLRALAELRHAGLQDIDGFLRPDRAAPAQPLFDDGYWDKTYASLRQFHRAMAAQPMLECLQALPEWPRARHLLDLGPGSATLARAVLKDRPDLDITLFDLPPVAARIAAEAADLPVTVQAGNYNDSLPQGSFDIIWCSMTLYFHAQGIDRLIARLAQLLKPGGVLISLHEGLHTDRTGPSEHVIGRIMPALRHGDSSFSRGEIAGAMQAAGLVLDTSQNLSMGFGEMQLDLARKEV